MHETLLVWPLVRALVSRFLGLRTPAGRILPPPFWPIHDAFLFIAMPTSARYSPNMKTLLACPVMQWPRSWLYAILQATVRLPLRPDLQSTPLLPANLPRSCSPIRCDLRPHTADWDVRRMESRFACRIRVSTYLTWQPSSGYCKYPYSAQRFREYRAIYSFAAHVLASNFTFSALLTPAVIDCF